MRGEEEEGWSRVTLLTLSPHSVSWTIDAGLTFAQCRCRPPDGQGIPENCRRVRNHSLFPKIVILSLVRPFATEQLASAILAIEGKLGRRMAGGEGRFVWYGSEKGDASCA